MSRIALADHPWAAHHAWRSVLLVAVSIGCAGTDEELQSVTHAATALCSIELGESGSTHRVSIDLEPGAAHSVANVGAWSFIRATRGPCHFQLFNATGLSGSHVTVGGNISSRIRIGADGFKNLASGGGDTWRARSLIVTRPATHTAEACSIGLGDNGVSMDVYDSIADLPRMDFVRYTNGRNCRFALHVGSAFAEDGASRYKYVFPGIDSDYAAGYNLRSVRVTSWTQSVCPVVQSSGSSTNTWGRCLPVSAAPSVPGDVRDSDADGVDERLESWVANTFSPVFIHDSDQAPAGSVEQPKLLYQVYALDPALTELQLSGAILWREDRGYGPSSTCRDPHDGDYSGLTLRVRRAPGTQLYAPVLVDLWHHARWEDGRRWNTDWGAQGINRGFDFDGTRARVFLSAHKHHPYTDAGWNHQASAYSSVGCSEDVNGRGVQLTAALVNVGDASFRFIASPAAADAQLFSYDFWTSQQTFCGNLAPGSSSRCTSTVLRNAPVARAHCAPPAWCP